MALKYLPNVVPFRFASSMVNRHYFDAIIVGGGMVGFGLAAATSASDILRHKHVLLIESSSQRTYRMNEVYEPRTVAINRSSQKLLQSLGAWDFIKSHRMQPVNQMKVWESQSDSYLTFERKTLAHIVENELVVEALRLATQKQPLAQLTVLYNARANAISLPPEDQPHLLATLEVQVENSPETLKLETSLLIGADGLSSKVRKAANLKTFGWDHGQSAVVASLCMSEGHEAHTAWQRFIPTGPIALLPLSAEHACLIWSTTNVEADRLLSLTDDAFVRELNNTLASPSSATPFPATILANIGKSLAQTIDSFCGQCKHILNEDYPCPPYVTSLQPGSVRCRYSLGFLHADFYHAPRVALVGDAAHRILPLAGQGVNLGFGDVASLVGHLEEAVSNGADLGSTEYLKQYTSDRQRVVVPMAAVLEALNLLYSNDAFTSKLFNVPGYLGATDKLPVLYFATQLLAGLRAAGLHSVQSSALIKNFLMEFAVNGRFGVLEDCQSE